MKNGEQLGGYNLNGGAADGGRKHRGGKHGGGEERRIHATIRDCAQSRGAAGTVDRDTGGTHRGGAKRTIAMGRQKATKGAVGRNGTSGEQGTAAAIEERMPSSE